MRQSNYRKGFPITITKKMWKIMGGCLAAGVLTGAIFFFTYFQVKNVQVMGNSRYSEQEIKDMVLRGPMASNSVLAPMLYSTDETKDIPFVDGFTVTRTDRSTICIGVKEKKPVGCIFYLDSYVYFDRQGIFIEGSMTRDMSVPFFDGIQVNKVVMEQKLPFKGTTVLNTAVALATIFQKNEMVPDHINFDDDYNISLEYGDITVALGKDKYLEDKMTRTLAILPLIKGEKGVLHLEGVTDSVKNITFTRAEEEITAENWNGGYDENGEYTGYGEYDENGRYVGQKPMTELDYALNAWNGGYDGDGDYTGAGEYDDQGNYVGQAPTQESIEAHGDWKGGYTEYGTYNGTGEFDHDGNYVGPNPNDSGSTSEEEGSYDSGDGSYSDGDNGYDTSGGEYNEYSDNSGYDDSYDYSGDYSGDYQ